GAAVVYMRSIHQLAEDLATQQPTVMIAVPRIFERFLGRIEQALAASTVKRLLFYATTRIGWRLSRGRAGFVERVAYPLLRRRVAAPVLARLGGKLRFAVSGGAPLESRVASAIVGLGLPLIQGYGLTEASPVVCANQWGGNDDPLSVGPPLPGVDIRLNLAHELLVYGPSVMRGYWNNPEATRAVVDSDGWLNTGDLAEVHAGRVYIKGRSKDILVLSNGEKASPDDIETAILDDPLFEQVMVVGEGRPFFVLLAVSAERDARKLLRHANARVKHLPRHCRLRRVIALHEPWTLEARLLTPTLKVKRDAVYHCFQGLIDDAYARR
ncbi:MAG TPA: long-chain fatty acid--CoA ligase, partial [Betaproteobacteria bacterium]|nr:long-chain fatty acid--CoA ligase [Betaproteobacteria bacterium]